MSALKKKRDEVKLRREEELDDIEVESGESEDDVTEINNKGCNKRGRKGQWTEDQVDDLVDVILQNENFKRRLIFINQKNQKNSEIYKKVVTELNNRNDQFNFTVQQVRNKFKRCISVCKSAAMTIKTATGINRFQDEKSYGNWFKLLYAVVKTRESCRPDLAVEPGSSTPAAQAPNETEEIRPVDVNQSQFVPSRGKKRKTNSEPNHEILEMVQKVLDKDPSSELIQFMKDDLVKAREHELKLFAMLCNQPATTAQSGMPESYHNMGSGTQFQNAPSGSQCMSYPAPNQAPSTSGSRSEHVTRERSGMFQRFQGEHFQDQRFQDEHFQNQRFQDEHFQDQRFQDEHFQNQHFQDQGFQDQHDNLYTNDENQDNDKVYTTLK